MRVVDLFPPNGIDVYFFDNSSGFLLVAGNSTAFQIVTAVATAIWPAIGFVYSSWSAGPLAGSIGRVSWRAV